MPKIDLSASMMCANFGYLARELEDLERSGVDSLHIDLMDGRFVDNFGMGYQDVDFLRKTSKIPMEAHLMMEDPHSYFDLLAPMNFSTVYIHPETNRDPAGALERLQKMGITPGIAINPGTSLEFVSELLYVAKKVLVLCVNPGHAGRTVVPYVDRKIAKLLSLRQEVEGYDYLIYLDGGCTPGRIARFSQMGVDGFILGTATLFGKDRDYSAIVQDLRRGG